MLHVDMCAANAWRFQYIARAAPPGRWAERSGSPPSRSGCGPKRARTAASASPLAARLDPIEPISASNGINLSKDVSDRVLVSFLGGLPRLRHVWQSIFWLSIGFSNSFAQENLYPADLDLHA